MGLGEYTSVRTQNEQVAAEVAKERRELERNPEGEAEELAQIWIGRGLPADLARQVAGGRQRNPEEALRVHAREELGVDPEEQPSPWTAAVSSFVCFSVGALIPLLPYLLGVDVLWPALAAGGVGLFVAGALWPGSPTGAGGPAGCGSWRSAAAAAGATYLVGRLIGVNVIGCLHPSAPQSGRPGNGTVSGATPANRRHRVARTAQSMRPSRTWGADRPSSPEAPPATPRLSAPRCGSRGAARLSGR